MDRILVNDKKPAEVIKEMMIETGVSHRQLAEKLGTTRQNVSLMFSNKSSGNVSVTRMCNIADALGYELIVVPKSSD